MPSIPDIPLTPIIDPPPIACSSPSNLSRVQTLVSSEDGGSSSEEEDFIQSPKRVKLEKDIDDVVDSLLEIGKGEDLFI